MNFKEKKFWGDLFYWIFVVMVAKLMVHYIMILVK